MMPSLPDDVISEILSWVPVKSVCRLRCVSRGWHAIISRPTFVATHKSRADPHLLLATRVGRDLRLLDMEGEVVRLIRGVGALWRVCDGLDGPVCVTWDNHFAPDAPVINVIDPATGDVLTTELNKGRLFTFHIGCAKPSGVYKMLCHKGNFPSQGWKVFTLGEDAKWRQVETVVTPPAPNMHSSYYCSNSVVTVNGVMHFLCTLQTMPMKEDYIFCYDLENEEWKESIKGPSIVSGNLQIMACTKYMVKLNDTLCLVQLEENLTDNLCTCMNLWLLADCTNGIWIKSFVIPMTSTVDTLIPLRMMGDGRKKLLFYNFHRRRLTRTLQVYDPLTGTCTHLTKFQDKFSDDVLVCDLHMECFASRKI